MHVVSVPQEDHSAFGVAVALNSAAVAFDQSQAFVVLADNLRKPIHGTLVRSTTR